MNTLISLFKEQLERESQKLAQEHGLQKRGDLLIYWYFLRLRGLTLTETQEIVCDDGGDLGIDAIRIDDDECVHFYQFKNPESMEKGFPGGEVDIVLSGLGLILARQHSKVANESLRQAIDEIYQIVPSGYRLHLVTSGQGLSAESVEKLGAFVEGLRGPTPDFFTWACEDLKVLQDEFYQKTLPTVENPIVFALDRQPPYQIRAANHDSYILHSTGRMLAELYQQHGEQLLQQNIRVYQGDRTTNASIKQTCTGADSPNFFHFNNGVTFLCESAQWDQFTGKLSLHHAQVVNGGQTIRVLANALQEGALKDDVALPVRIITSQGDKEFASNVAVNLNNQNRVESSFLRSNNPRIIQLANSLASMGWYLERRQDELSRLSDAEKGAIERRIGVGLAGRVIPLKEGTQAYVATFVRQPELAKKNPQRMFLGVSDGGQFERVFDEQISADKFVAAHRIRSAVEAFVQKFVALKRRKARLANWQLDYRALLGADLLSEHNASVDQVVPQCSVFLAALVFEEHVRLRGTSPADLASQLENDCSLLRYGLLVLLRYARDNPTVANKSWPTLLKSQPFFENVCSYVKGTIDRR